MRRAILVLWSLALPLGGCGLDDGVVSVAFGLSPATPLELPAPEEVGGLSPFAFAGAEGRCDTKPPEGVLTCKLEAVPPITDATDAPYYRLILQIGPHDVLPPASGGHVHAAEELRDAGRVVPDLAGRVELTAFEDPWRLARVIGGTVELVVPAAMGDPAVYPVLEGETGNLPNDPGTPVSSGGGGHQH